MGNTFSGSRDESMMPAVVFQRQFAPEAVGRLTWSCVWGYRNACFEALRRAEALKGSPPYVIEIAAQWNSIIPWLAPFYLITGLQDLYKTDIMLADKEHNRFSLNAAMQSTAENPSEFELYSDKIYRLFPTYVLDQRCRIRPGPATVTMSFNQIKEVLLSRDLSRNAELEWVSGQNLRFLDGSDMTGLQVVFNSFPRTGNSFVRRMIELCTGIYTGSDMNIDITQQIIGGNIAGEETVSHENLCWITKTHWPMESPLGATKFSAQRCIAVVRNPTEVIPSMALLFNTTSHSLKTTVPLN